MKKLMPFLVLMTCCLFFAACNTASPERYFDLAVLGSCNSMTGFANSGLQRELDQPSVKMVNGDKDHPVSMKRKEVIDFKIETLEDNLAELKQLKPTPDTREMLETSIALNEFVLAGLKNEYEELAELYDTGASKEEIATLSHSIETKYSHDFEELYGRLTALGKSYAQRNNINVNWLK
jgi:predicted small secreted protein